jgi:hypothetical protein
LSPSSRLCRWRWASGERGDFSLFNQILLTPLAVPEPTRLVNLSAPVPSRARRRPGGRHGARRAARPGFEPRVLTEALRARSASPRAAARRQPADDDHVCVAPRGFDSTTLGLKLQIFAPITMRGLSQPFKGCDNRGSYWAYLFARPKPGVSIEQAQAAIRRRGFAPGRRRRRLRSSVPEFGAGVQCRSSVPEFGAGAASP